MADIKIALSITHAPWDGQRVASMARLRGALGIKDASAKDGGCSEIVAYHEETQRAPWWVWSDSQQRWGAACEEATHVAYGQDDSLVAPVFWPALRAIIAARPNDVIALHCPHPGSMKLAREGVRWCSTADGLVGLFYVFPKLVLRDEYIRWRETSLRPGGASAPELAEDSFINVWCVCTGRRVFHPIPTIVDHDLSMRSTWGADSHAYRRPRVLWSDGEACGWSQQDLCRESFWTDSRCQHLGRVYAKTHWAAKLVVPGFQRFFDVETDVCPPEYSRFFTCQ